MYFRNYGLAKMLLHMYLKSAVSQYRLTSNMVKVPKYISNDHSNTFIILIDHQQGY